MDQKVPNFYCIGTQKAGTTTLHEILKHHPEIYLPERKEAHFFHKDQLYKKGKDWYLQEHFSDVKSEKIVGSFTPEYLYFEASAKRIFDTFGRDMKFLVILRNPADRAFSHYKMSKFRGFETLPFEEAITIENKRIKESLHKKINFSYIDRGFYSKQISRYLEYFPLDNFLFINFEDELIKDIDKTLEKICDFFEVEFVDLNTNIQANTAKEAIFPKVNRVLINKPEILEKISSLLPGPIKRSARSFLEQLNTVKTENDELDNELKRELIQRIFYDDIQNLRSGLPITNKWLTFEA